MSWRAAWPRRLRGALGDPLFVRSGRGLAPTPRALELLPALDAAIGHLRRVVEGPTAFDPRTTTRRFTIASTDGEATVLIPRLMPLLAREMPRASVRIVSLDVAVGGQGLAGGEVDVIAGLAVAASEGCHRRALYRDTLALIARRGPPGIDGAITLAQRSRVAWIDTLVLMGRRGVGGEMAQKTFAHHAVARTVALAVPSFTMAALAVAHSDCIAGVPRRLAEALAPGLPIVVLDPPFASPPMEIALVWHPRTDADPGHRCFRDLLAAAAAADDASGSSFARRRRLAP